jgi:transposase
MISPETRAQIRRYFYAEHWKVGTIAAQLGVHPDAVRNAIETQRLGGAQPLRPSIVDPYLAFIGQTLEQHPRLCATRIYPWPTSAAIRQRGPTPARRFRLRPRIREPFLRLETFPGEQAQVDWAPSATSWSARSTRSVLLRHDFIVSRALYLEFFFDQTTENFLRGHVHTFQAWRGQPRAILYDNLKSAVLERRGSQILFNPRLIELTAHYHFTPQPCQVRAGNQKGRVERAIRYVRDSFWAGRTFTTLAECNRQSLLWRDQVAHQRRWRTGRPHRRQAFHDEQPRLLPPPLPLILTASRPCVRARPSMCLRSQRLFHPRVGRPLTRAASDPVVRLLDGATEIARHPRTYDRQQQVLDPTHRDAVLKLKRKAFHATPAGRLEQAVPESKTLLDLAFAKGESALAQTSQLLKLLDEHGPAALRRAIVEAVERNTPRASSVTFWFAVEPPAQWP